jgi:c-di-GMP-binding flagellar brake protein YcgR
MDKTYLTIQSEKGKKAKGYLLDLSRTGAGIASCERIIKNTLVEITPRKSVLPLIKGRVITIVDRHRKDYPYRLGVRFVLMSETAQQKITHFILKAEKRRKPRLKLL